MLNIKRSVSLLLALVLCLALASCKEANMRSHDPEPKPDHTPPPASDQEEDRRPTRPVVEDTPKEYVYEYYKWPDDELTAYNGTVQHLMFHQVLAYPELAFDNDEYTTAIDDAMLTVTELNRILDNLYKNNYILVNMNDVWSEHTPQRGPTVMVRNTLRVPKGKKPLIISIDDPCYFEKFIGNGIMEKLVQGEDGQIWAWGHDPEGNEILSQDLDIIPIIDKFVKQHPDFSLNGAKGCLALSGYEGILGYRTNTVTTGMTEEEQAKRLAEIEAVKPIVEQLKKTGWYFGCHTWGTIRLDSDSYDVDAISRDMGRWQTDVGDIVGPTTLFFYPHGGRPDGDDWHQTGEKFKYLQSLGYRVFASIGNESFSFIKEDICAVICDRMHADGNTLRNQRKRYLPFYDAKEVYDYSCRPDLRYDFDD